MAARGSRAAKQFQSTPANFTAGDGAVLAVAVPHQVVSIRARQFHSGRQAAMASGRLPAMLFQYTPANFTAGDAARRRGLHAIGVSIHARQFHSGRPVAGSTTAGGMRQFQSTPANFTAGDADLFGAATAAHRFQSTPANFTAGDSPRPAVTRPTRCFNPRPPISQRATAGRQARAEGLLVSIHARQFHSGRPTVTPSLARPHFQFQSTPANFPAGDRHPPAVPCGEHMFQSTPANFTAGDRW